MSIQKKNVDISSLGKLGHFHNNLSQWQISANQSSAVCNGNLNENRTAAFAITNSLHILLCFLPSAFACLSPPLSSNCRQGFTVHCTSVPGLMLA